MRVTEARILDISSNAMVKARDAAATATTVESSGIAVAKPSDDLAKWTEAQRVDARNSESQQRGNAISTATTDLEATDNALSAIGTSLDSARVLATQAANGTMSADQRAAAAVSINALRDTIVGQANSKGADGQYLLSGSQSSLAPFDALGNYAGDSKTRAVGVSESASVTTSISGSILTSANGVNVVGVLNSLSQALASNDQAGITSSLDDLQTAVSQVAVGRETLGGSLSALQQADDARTSFELQLATRKNALVDVDAVAGATALAQAKNQLDTANSIASEVVAMTAPNRT
jgi:flagellar hook-associated protein 3 FlgL